VKNIIFEGGGANMVFRPIYIYIYKAPENKKVGKDRREREGKKG
jgi:hypothetical protein